MVRAKTRSLFRQLHLYAGLCCGAIFVLSGLTGGAIAWRHEFDSMLNPDLFHIAPAAGVSADGPASITPAKVQQAIERLTADPHYGRPTQIMLPQHANQTLIAWYRRQPSSSASLLALETSRQVMLDPDTLQIAGERNWGEIGLTRRLLMPTLFRAASESIFEGTTRVRSEDGV